MTVGPRNPSSKTSDMRKSLTKQSVSTCTEMIRLDMYAIQCEQYFLLTAIFCNLQCPIKLEGGTAADVSFLIDFLPAYLFPMDDRSIYVWGVAGKSLGGHSTWLILAHGKSTSR